MPLQARGGTISTSLPPTETQEGFGSPSRGELEALESVLLRLGLHFPHPRHKSQPKGELRVVDTLIRLVGLVDRSRA